MLAGGVGVLENWVSSFMARCSLPIFLAECAYFVTYIIRVLPHVATRGFDPIGQTSLVNDFYVIDTEAGADPDRARAILEPFKGKPHSDLLQFLRGMCVVPTAKPSHPSAHR
jgi:hypothetical protein